MVAGIRDGPAGGGAVVPGLVGTCTGESGTEGEGEGLEAGKGLEEGEEGLGVGPPGHWARIGGLANSRETSNRRLIKLFLVER